MSKDEYHAWKKCGILPKRIQKDSKVILCSYEQRSDTVYAQIVLTDEGLCPYLTEKGLCEIQRDRGLKEMTKTCRIFPRRANSYFGRVECSLSLGCERVLELLLAEKDGLLLEEGKPQIFEIFGSNYDIQDRRKYPKLRSYYDIQTLCLALLQSDNMTLENRLVLLGMAIEKVEALYQEGNGEHTAGYINNFLEMAQQQDVGKLLQAISNERPLAVFNSVMSALLTMNFPDTFKANILEKAAQAVDKKKKDNIEDPELEYFLECKERFSQWISGKEYFLENVMVMYLLWSNIPFKNLEKSMWENYLYLVWVYVMVKGCLIFALNKESTDEDMIDCCVIMFRKLGHNERNFLKIIDAYRAEGDTPAHAAILLRNL